MDAITPEKLQNYFGLNLTTTSTICNFSVGLGDEDKSIGTSALDQESLQSTWSRFEALASEKERDLQERYRIRIGHNGEFTTEEGYGRYSKSSYKVQVRSANLGELCALEYALLHSAPSHLLDNGAGLHIYFLKERRTCGVIAEWGYDRDNQAAIFVEPNYDKTPKGKHLELVLIHEFAHNSQVRTGMDAYKPESWQLARMLGWHPFTNPDTGEKGWLICSKEEGNYFYKLGQLSGLWVRCNQNGQPQAEDGRTVERQIDAVRLTAQKMMEIAQIRPATTYFSNPMEMYAEGMMMLRADRSHRHELATTNRSLYELLKEQDQSEINNTFGSAAFIRNADGVLVADNAMARKELAGFESTMIAAATMAH